MIAATITGEKVAYTFTQLGGIVKYPVTKLANSGIWLWNMDMFDMVNLVTPFANRDFFGSIT